jgi:hypothetical protein
MMNIKGCGVGHHPKPYHSVIHKIYYSECNMTVELMNKRFTLSISTIVGIVTAVASIVGVYWKMSSEVALSKAEIATLKETVVELKGEISKVEGTLWDVTTAYNDMAKGLHSTSTRRSIRSLSVGGVGEADTVDLGSLKPIRKEFKR